MKKLITIFAAAFVLLCAFCLSCSAEQEDLTSPYDLFVAGISVTEENRDDILADGTASYDAASNTLTLDGMNRQSFVSTSYVSSEGVEVPLCLSVLSTAEKGLNVVIRGKCNFMGGIYISGAGSIKAEDAELVFGNGASCYIDCVLGALEMVNCTVKIQGTDGLRVMTAGRTFASGFNANDIRIKDSQVQLAADNVSTNYTDAFCFAMEDLYIEHSKVKVKTPFPVFSVLFGCNGKTMGITDSKMDIGGQELVFSCANGAISISDNCRIVVKNTDTLLYSDSFAMDDSVIKAHLYYNGMLFSGSQPTALSLIKNSTLRLSLLSFSAMEKNVWKPYWRSMQNHDATGDFGDYSEFLSYIKDNVYGKMASNKIGITRENGSVIFESSAVTIRGFDMGVFVYGTAGIKFMGRMNMRIRGCTVPLVLITTTEDTFEDDAVVRTSGGSLLAVEIPKNVSSVYRYLYTYAPSDFALSAQDNQSVLQIATLASGFPSELSISSMYLPVWVYILIMAAIFAAVCFVVWFAITKITHSSIKSYKTQKTSDENHAEPDFTEQKEDSDGTDATPPVSEE